mmetsp:Transcript_28788/g.63436  ORF Transcript_28788/g.63436 Transcript_28788/m.63436 type:complete len:214 (-) Transcript_28788:30-671(-)
MRRTCPNAYCMNACSALELKLELKLEAEVWFRVSPGCANSTYISLMVHVALALVSPWRVSLLMSSSLSSSSALGGWQYSPGRAGRTSKRRHSGRYDRQLASAQLRRWSNRRLKLTRGEVRRYSSDSSELYPRPRNQGGGSVASHPPLLTKLPRELMISTLRPLAVWYFSKPCDTWGCMPRMTAAPASASSRVKWRCRQSGSRWYTIPRGMRMS